MAAVVLLHAGAAGATGAPQVGPAPGWVSPAPAIPPEKDDAKGLPVALLLNDIQLNFDADGWTEFHRLRARVQSPQGLQALGALPFQWSPWSDTLTFHSASILRDGQVIDVLPKDGAFTVLRRETGLEQAMLTGELTAVLQPDGLQVGDVLEVVASIRHADPLLKTHMGAMFANWDASPVGRMRLLAHWPSSLPVRWQESAGLPALNRSEAGGVASISLDLQDVRPPVLPAHAPTRFQHGRMVEFTTFADWKDVAATVAPLFAKAGELGPQSPVAEQARLIAKASSDPKARASAALRLVQTQVRYLAHAEAAAGYTPQTADETWRLRYGDCKAKTVLLIALLRELGIQAEPVLANIAAGDGVGARLPSVTLFDHVLVRARIGGRDYWLDGARQGDRSVDDAPIPAYGWVLPLDAAAPVQLRPLPAERPDVLQVIRYDASGGVTAPEPTHLESTFRGDAAVVLHAQLAAVPPDRLEASLKSYWTEIHTAFTPTHVTAAWDADKGEEKLAADGTSKLDWSGSGLELQNVEFGGAPDIKRDPAASDPDAPYLVQYPSYVETDESVVLPPGDAPPPDSAKAAEFDKVIGGIAYRRTATVSSQTLTVVATQRALQPEISAVEARASVEPLTKLGAQGIYAPAGTQAKAADDAAAIDSNPSTAEGHVDRGKALMDKNRVDEGIAEFDAAIALDPKSQAAFAARALAYAWRADPAAATDADKADMLGRPESVAAHARAILAANSGDLAGERAAYRHALTVAPDDAFSLRHLVELDLTFADVEAGREDLKALKQADGGVLSDEHLVAAAIEREAGHKAAAEQELAQAPADTADDLIERGRAYLELGDRAKARADVDAAIRLEPSVKAWLVRAAADGGYDSPAANSDLEAAAKLAPDDLQVLQWRLGRASVRRDFTAAASLTDKLIEGRHGVMGDLLITRAQFEARLGRMSEADSDFSRGRTMVGAEAAHVGRLCQGELWARWRPEMALLDCEHGLLRAPRSVGLMLDRVILLHRLGRDAEAAKALDALEALNRSPGEMNNVCYSLATEGMLLDRALAECDASLKLAPDVPATLDSRGFTLMRLGREAEALGAYDAALAIMPEEYNSVYGRGLVEAKLGRVADSERDLHAALAAQPHLRDDFTEMGVK